MIKNIKLYIKNNPEKILFIFSFIYLVFLGITLTYNYNLGDKYNLLFDSDTKRVVQDITSIIGKHTRADVHPLFVLLIQPIYFIINGILLNKYLSIVTITALISSLTVYFLYKILNKIRKDKNTNIIISLIFLFSFSNIIFTASPETYNFSAFFLLLLWYYYISKKDKYTITSYIVLVILGILSFAFTITNICIFLIIMGLLLLEKKLSIKKSFIVLIAVVISVTGLNVFQKTIWNNIPVFFKLNVKSETTTYIDKKYSLKNVKNVIENDYYNSIISSDIKLNIKNFSVYNNKNYVINFRQISIINTILLTIFYISLLILIIRNFKKNKLLNIGVILALSFNTILHILYGNDSTFLYSEHFLYLIILLFGINYLNEDNIKIRKPIKVLLIILLVFEIIKNNYIFIKIISYVKEFIEPNYLLSRIGLVPTLIIEIIIIIGSLTLLLLIINTIKNIKNEKNKEKIILLKVLIIGLVIIFESIFILLNSVEINNRFLIFDLNNINEFMPKNKQYYTNKKFKKYFEKELKSLDEYQKEMNDLMSNYDHIKVDIVSWEDNYYFGLGNRKKLLYQQGTLVDVESKEVIKKIDVKEQFIIPNIYTVIIETKKGDYIKIYEDNNGIHYTLNGKDKLLDDNKIELYDFSNQKYKNIKKELYGELLFNIKDNIIYPNIIVYDKPWYRDAALTCMVLKQTNNTNLIDEWVNNITDIYDMQNANQKEPDNLGELLYIISTQENRNEELLDRIEEEAERIAKDNPNGYYIYGQTDFGDKHLYQNLWYKLGIESVGREFKFDLSKIPEDDYARMAWWSDYKINNYIEQNISEDYPYLSYATYHKTKKGSIPINNNLYPLSWEKNGSQAKYENYDKINLTMSYEKISQIHSWSSAELLLLLMDETGDLNM